MIARSAGLTGAATLVSRVLGLVRDLVLAAYFGAGNQMDAFLVAFRLPNLVRDLFAEGTMSAAFVPAFTRHLAERGRAAAWQLGAQVINALLLATGVLIVLGVLFAEPLVRLYAGDYAAIPGKLELTIHLTRIMLPFLTLVAVAAAMMGMLNALHHYFVPALAPATFNAVVIVGALTLVPLAPHVGLLPISAVAIASLLGGLAQVVTQWPALRREGYRHAWRVDPRDPGLHQVLLLMGPGTLGLAATQLNLFVNTHLATAQGTGAVSWLSYAFRLMYFPIGLVGVSIATAVLPEAARHASKNDPRAIGETLSTGLRLMLLLSLPATVGLIVLATPIVRLIFERGAFTPDDTLATASALQCYALGLIGYASARIASPVFYALGQSRLPVTIATASVAVNIVASIALASVIGFRGLALGTSIAALVHGGIAVWLLHTRLGSMGMGRLVSSGVRIAIASAVMGLIVWITASALPARSGLIAETITVAVPIAVGLIVFGVSAKIMRIAEVDVATSALQAALGARRSKSARTPA